MPKIRIGLSTDFNLTGEQVGIGTTNPTARLEVAGQILADNTAGSGGISTFKEYQGFYQTQSSISNKVTIDATTAGNLNSLSGEIRIDGDVTIASDTSVTSGKIDSLTATGKFAVPYGGIGSRENTPEPGTIRFNQDVGTLEFFDGNIWKTVNSQSSGGSSGRVVFCGGLIHPVAPTLTKRMDYINLNTFGNSISFGELKDLTARRQTGGCSSSTRGLFMGGQGPGSNTNEIVYITIPTTGNAVDFGNLLAARQTCQTLSSSTRGISYGAGEPAVNVIEYVEIPTTGDSIDFGDADKLRRDGFALASPTRGVSGGGTGGTNAESLIEYITIASKGNGTEFGNLSYTGRGHRAFSNSVRGIVNGGYAIASPYVRSPGLQYITIATTGNAVDFGNLTIPMGGGSSSGTQSNHIRGVFAGASTPSNVNNIEYVTIASSGNGFDFGDLSSDSWNQTGACSNSHGGLGGF